MSIIGDISRKEKSRSVLLDADLLFIVDKIQYATDIINIAKGQELTVILGDINRKISDYTQLEIRDYLSIITQLRKNTEDIASIKGIPISMSLNLLERNCQEGVKPGLTDFLCLVEQIQTNTTALATITVGGKAITVTDVTPFILLGNDVSLLRSNPRLLPISLSTFSLSAQNINLLYSSLSTPTASFTNVTSPTHKVWRDGTPSTGTINVPAGYGSIAWQIVRHQRYKDGIINPPDIVASGTGTTVSWTPVYNGTNLSNTYYIRVTGTKGGAVDLDDTYAGEITVYPAKFTEGQADVVIDVSTSFAGTSNNWTDFAATGRKIYVKGTYNGAAAPNFFYWLSTNPLKPVHVIMHNVSISSTSYLMKVGPNRNFIIDGCDDENVPYGLTLQRVGSSGIECVYCVNADSAHDSSDWIFGGISIHGGSWVTSGTGLAVQMTNNATFNVSTSTLNSLTFHRLSIKEVGNEIMYVGHTIEGSTPEYCGLSNCLYYNIIADTSRNESCQIGAHNGVDIFNNIFNNSGLGNGAGQNYNTQVSHGNKNVFWYRNRGLTTKSMLQTFTGKTGGAVEMFANIYETSGALESYFHISKNSLLTNVYLGVYNNLFIGPSNGGIPFNFYNDTDFGTPSAIHNPCYFDSNILISGTLINHTINNGFDSTYLIMNNKAYTNINTPSFVNIASRDYRPSTLSSSIMSFPRNVVAGTRIHPLANYDINGHIYPSTNTAAGPNAGWELMTGSVVIKNITSINALSDITNIANGTVIANIPGLPTSVVVNLNDNSTRSLSIVTPWTSATYNGSVANTYVIDGTVNLPSDITNSGNLKAHLNATVLAAAAPVSFKINFALTGSQSGWFTTGSVGPSGTGNGTPVDYGQIASTGIGIRALSVSGTQWTGTGAAGGTTATIVPDAVQQTYWYNFNTNGAFFELYEFTGGSLVGRTFTLKFYGSRSGIQGPRTVLYSAESGQSATLNVAAPGGVENNLEATLTGVTPINGIIKITVKSTTPTDSVAAYLNGMEVDSE